MAKEFFQEFGEAFTKTMRDIGERAESFYSEQKLRNKISGEEKMCIRDRYISFAELILFWNGVPEWQFSFFSRICEKEG